VQIQENPANIVSMSLQGARPSRETAADTHETALQTDSSNPAPQVRGNNPSGTAGSNLSPQIVEYLIQLSQPEAGTEPMSSVPLQNADRRHLQRIAQDPDYAATQAKTMASYGELSVIGKDPFPRNGAPDSEWQAFWQAQDLRVEQVNRVNQDRRELYQRLVDQDLPPAQIYAALLKFNASQPDSHDALVGMSETTGSSYSDWNGARLAYLQEAMTQTVDIRSPGDGPEGNRP